MNKVQLSVVVPTYNVEAYLAECLDSILAQGIADLEIIIVNDGSTDRSGAVAKQFVQQYPKSVRLVEQENQGLSVARNTGLAHSSGEYVLFLDSDDFLTGSSLAELLDYGQKQQLDIVIGNYINWYSTTHQVTNKPIRQVNQLEGKYWLKAALKNHRYQPMVWYKLYRRRFLEQNQLNFVPQLINEDQLFNVQALMQAQRVGCIDAPFYCYRHREGSITKVIEPKSAEQKVISDLFSVNKMAEIARNQDDRQLAKLIRKQSLRIITDSMMNLLQALQYDFTQVGPYFEQMEKLQLHRAVKIRRLSHINDFITLRKSPYHYFKWRLKRHSKKQQNKQNRALQAA